MNTQMILTSSAFQDGERIPDQYTCVGQDMSPPLRWENAPQGVKSYALLVDDPDVESEEWVHWVVFNIPANVTSLDEHIACGEKLASGAIQGANSWNDNGYGGPCPPLNKVHRYTFRLYALDSSLSLSDSATKEDLLGAIEGHVLAESQLVGIFGQE